MFGEVDKRGAAHRRLGTGVRRLNKRVFTPTAVYGSDTDTATRLGFPEPTFPVILPTTDPITTSTRNTILLPPTTSTTPILLPTTTTSITPVTTSTTPSTTSTSTTSSATPTTTSSSVTPTTTQPPTTQAQITQPVQQTTSSRSVADQITDVTQTLTSTRTPNAAAASTSAAPSASSTSDAHPSTSSGVIIGGIIAAVIGVAGILFAVIYFIRRNHKSSGDGEDDDNDFNAQAFRRQSVALRDEDEGPVMSRAMTFNRGGGNPRPPTMIERKMASTPVSSQNVPPMSHPYGYASSGYAVSYNQSFAPGQIMAQDPYTPATVNSANPFFSPYGDSPIGTPVSVAPYGSAYESQGQPISRQPTNASSAVLSRQPSSAVQPAPQGMHEGEYVDLSRSSVTPFQAAQYAEISRRLNTAPPQALPASEVAEVAEELAEQDEPAPVVPQKNVEPLELQPSISFDESQRLTVQPTPRENSFPESPFADPTMSMHEEQAQQLSHHDSIRDSFPQPPSPTYSSKSRVTSKPPTLPEIQIQQRPFSPVSLEFPIAPSSPHPAPSPLGSSFSALSPPPSAHFPDNVGPTHEPEPAPVSATAPAPAPAPVAIPRENSAMGGPVAKRPDTVYTLYDEEDAYAGI